MSWCLNILTNSNFILRLVEWQSESSLFNLRVRGKQWYWIYKIDINNINNLKNTSKQTGFNGWSIFFKSNNNIMLDIIQLQNKLVFQKNFWKKSLNFNLSEKNNLVYDNNSKLAKQF